MLTHVQQHNHCSNVSCFSFQYTYTYLIFHARRRQRGRKVWKSGQTWPQFTIHFNSCREKSSVCEIVLRLFFFSFLFCFVASSLFPICFFLPDDCSDIYLFLLFRLARMLIKCIISYVCVLCKYERWSVWLASTHYRFVFSSFVHFLLFLSDRSLASSSDF